MAFVNASFEQAGTQKGGAAGWTLGVRTDATSVGRFSYVSDLLWLHAEAFAQLWRMPYLVHEVQDIVHAVTAASATDQATAITLANNIKVQFNAHLSTLANVHLAEDTSDLILHPDAADATSLYTLLNALKLKFNAHVQAWPSVHAREDITTYIDNADATNLPTAIVLANELKQDYNAHRLVQGLGQTNSDALFAFTATNLANAIFALGNLTVDSFERDWAIPDLFPDPSEQRSQVSMDDVPAEGSAYIVHSIAASLVGADNFQLTGGESVSWPGGHYRLLDNFDLLETQKAWPIPESFDADWRLPGSANYPRNNAFFDKYYNIIKQVFEFVAMQLAAALFNTASTEIESFESKWLDNEVGFAKYWDPTTNQWRFETSAIELGIADSFETDWPNYVLE